MDVSFEQIYQQLSEKHKPQLKAMRNSILRKLLLAGGISAAAVVLLILVSWELALGLLPTMLAFGFILFFFLKERLKHPYVLYFRENVAKEFVEMVDKNLSYAPEPPEMQVFSRQMEEIYNTQARKLWRVGRIFAAVIILLSAAAAVTASVAIKTWLIVLAITFILVLGFHAETIKRRQLKAFGLSYPPIFPDTWILDHYHTAGFDGKEPFLNTIRLMVPYGTRGSPGLSNLITGKIERRPFELCCMSLKGDSAKFKGLFVSINVSKKLKGFIKVERKVRRRRSLGAPFIPKAERRKMDSPAFEKDFRVGSNDQVTAMQYLTADVMELLLNFKNELIEIQTRFNRNLLPRTPIGLFFAKRRIRLDFFWEGDEVLMRLGNKKMFKPTMRDPMCKESLACCYSSLTFATRLNHVITKSIKETSI